MGGRPLRLVWQGQEIGRLPGPERAPNCAPHARTKNGALENDAEQIESVCVSR